ncbi:hypothetical protein PR003_g1831 [Phytophthora rubi]|uniref:Secreted protein n=1 Tax=Phytophthora rubi TaxID=129364 RepID=A0A6A4G6T0_9STRA|nr:hypothetical protein PR002_g1654 [Phytophthora rubi]KAE9051300.1 hypothetical protein PR001_g1566 [Phytophthora rubi]KAE9357342.1 hypothetical protein PR003_g1831 [Phytophthora rubi]
MSGRGSTWLAVLAQLLLHAPPWQQRWCNRHRGSKRFGGPCDRLAAGSSRSNRSHCSDSSMSRVRCGVAYCATLNHGSRRPRPSLWAPFWFKSVRASAS